jgi:hypothetical protein
MNNKVLRIFFATLSITAINMVFAALTCGWAFNWVYKLEPVSIWKLSYDCAPGNDFIFGLFLLNIIFTYVFFVLYTGIPGKNKYIKGILYGLIIWATGMLPGMFSTLTFMNISPVVVLYWTIWGLVLNSLKGIVVSLIYYE